MLCYNRRNQKDEVPHTCQIWSWVSCKDQHPLAYRQSWHHRKPDGWDLTNMLQKWATCLVPEVDHPLLATFSSRMTNKPAAKRITRGISDALIKWFSDLPHWPLVVWNIMYSYSLQQIEICWNFSKWSLILRSVFEREPLLLVSKRLCPLNSPTSTKHI